MEEHLIIKQGTEPISVLSDNTKEKLQEIVFNGELRAVIDEAIGDDPDLEV
jgi:hypothetical protein